MATTLTWYGHGCWLIEAAGGTLLLDPYLDDSPTAPVKADTVRADYLLVSHGHEDHVADVAKIANRTGATLISNWEICEWYRTRKKEEQVAKREAMNLGGTIKLPFAEVKSTIAHHSSTMPDGSPGGNPGGFLLTFADGKKVYFACDTALFGDMALIGEEGIELAVLPIGDRFTMGPADSIRAIKLLRPKRVAPAHYNTWPPIGQDAAAWAGRVRAETSAEPIVIEPGGRILV
jgi:L-ascorbate metabolism protein UlaG (beta-lactamase superfamily)